MQGWEREYYIREDGREEGREEGRREGLTKGMLMTKQVLQLAAVGKSISEIAAECGFDESFVKEVLAE